MEALKKLIIVVACALMGMSYLDAAYRPRQGRRALARKQVTRRTSMTTKGRSTRLLSRQVPVVKRVPQAYLSSKVSKPEQSVQRIQQKPATALQCSICRQQCTPQRPNVIKYPCMNASVIHPVCAECLEKTAHLYRLHCPTCGEYYSEAIKLRLARPHLRNY